ncbi:hypothetical protein ACWD25_40205 [Streptomyces sp. NPDC002920]
MSPATVFGIEDCRDESKLPAKAIASSRKSPVAAILLTNTGGLAVALAAHPVVAECTVIGVAL